MHPRDRERLRQVVSDALERDAAERRAYLRERCPPELLSDALDLISHADDLGFTREVEERIGFSLAQLSSDDPPRIGSYEVLEKIGEGGMGVAYRARQTGALDRVVALKVIRPTWSQGDFAGRFEAEERAIARMSHPNIASVYEAGRSDDGVSWFAMEYVEGSPLLKHCDEKGLLVRGRLELFIRLCAGVEHAHQKGIIHRDLKPSNVLVAVTERGPEPKIIDFGIAKAMDGSLADDELRTVEGQMIGTPEYMSPERLTGAGDVDTRADVYSLGVILYELLCGELPFDRATTRRIGHSRETETVAQPPSTRVTTTERSTETAMRRNTSVRELKRLLRGELDWICLKALALRPDQRYATAHALGEDVRRHLTGDIVAAGPPTARYRLGKFARRYRVPLAMTAVVVGSLTGGLVVANQQRIAAEAAHEAAESVTGFLADMLAEVQPGSGNKDVTVRQVLDQSAQRLQSGQAMAPEVEARLLQTIGDSYYALGRWDEAAEARGRAVQIFVEAAGPRSAQALEARRGLARAHLEQNRFDETETELSALQADAERTWGARAVETLRLQIDLGWLLYRAGRLDEAESVYRQAVIDLTEVAGAESEEVATLEDGLASVLVEKGGVHEAVALTEHALSSRRQRLGPEDASLLPLYNNLALLRYEQGQIAPAESLLTMAWELRKRLFGPDHSGSITAQINLAWLRETRGKIDSAVELLSDAVPRAREQYGPESATYLTAKNNLAFLYLDKLDRYEDAEALLDEVVATRSRVLGEAHVNTMASRNNLALVYEKTGRLEQAEKLNLELFELRRATLGEDHPHTALSRDNLARVRVAQASRAGR